MSEKENKSLNQDDNFVIKDESDITEAYLLKRLAEIESQFQSPNNQSEKPELLENEIQENEPSEENHLLTTNEEMDNNEQVTLHKHEDNQPHNEDNENIVEEQTQQSHEEEQVEPDKKKKDPHKVLKLIVLVLFVIFVCLLGYILLNVFSSEPNKNVNPPKDVVTKPSPTENPNIKPIMEETKKTISDILKEIEDTNIPSIHRPSEETTEFYTYHNSALNISFDYPLDWVEDYNFQLLRTPDHVKNIVLVGTPAESDMLENFRITVELTPVTITAKEYIRQTEERMQDIFPKFQSVDTGEITVSGKEAPTRMYLWVPQSELDRSPYPQEWTRIMQYQIYVSGNQKMYVLTFTSTDKMFAKNYPKYEQLLSTLQLGI